MSENKRTAAYENIFGRPSAQHHRPSSTVPPSYLQQQQQSLYPQPQYRGPPNGQQYQQYPQQSYPQQYYTPQQQPLTRSYTSASSQHSSYSHHYSSSQTYAALPQPPLPSPPPPPQQQQPQQQQQQSQLTGYRPSLDPPREYQLQIPPSLRASNIGAPLPPLPPPEAPDSGPEQYSRQVRHSLHQPSAAPTSLQNWNPYRPVPSPQHLVFSINPPPPPSQSPPQLQSQQLMQPESESTSLSHSIILDVDEPNDSSQEESSLPYISEPPKPTGLHLATTFPTHSANSISSPDSSNNADAPSPSRRSSESIPTLPLSTIRQRTGQDRAQSMSAISSSQNRPIISAIRNSHPTTLMASNSASSASPSPSAAAVAPRRRATPVVYPALLSRVAEAFRARVTLSERVKDGLLYQEAFDGRDAVDKLAYIIKTSDRCLALLLGRALDAQKFFHDVTYDHRLRDSVNEVYQFRKRLASPFVSGEELAGKTAGNATAASSAPTSGTISNGTPRPSMSAHQDSGTDSSILNGVNKSLESSASARKGETDSADEDSLPTGVFTLLTDCYSPTCSRDRLCYSIACPRRLEQQSRLNLKQEPGLKRTISRESLGDLVEPGTLWIHSVPQEVVDSVSETEKKRQEAINEVIYTERDFVRDMEYLRDLWVKPLQTSDIIPQERRQEFIKQVFWNINDIIAVNTRLRDALNKRQKSYAIVEKLGDILMESVPNFGPFVSYGAHQLYGKYEFEREKTANLAFAQFVEDTERKPESRKLELNGYLTKPTTRLARYPLLLEVVLKYTPEENSDKTVIPQVVKIVREFLAKVNAESGKTENRFNLLQLDQQLVFRPGENVDLKLKDEERELVYKGALNKRGGQGDSGELQIFLFDHALLMVKQKTKHEQYKVYRRPVPLELLVILGHDDNTESKPSSTRNKNTLVKASTTSAASNLKGDNKNGYPITFIYLGRRGYSLTLWASTWVARKKWIEQIQKQQEKLRENSTFFETRVLNEGFFNGMNKVNCAAPFHTGRRVAYGTADGVYFSDLREPKRDPVKVIALADVVQLDVLDEYQLLIVLSEGAVITFPLDALDPRDPSAGLKRAKRISAHTSFFKAGYCLNRMLVCVVKSSQLSSTIKVLEPIDYTARGKSKPTFRKLLQGGNDTLRLFREFYIPVESNSIHILKSRLCVGCIKGFEIIDLETLDTQTLLDPEDRSLDFIQKREFVRPMAIYRIDHDFLLCYDEFAFYINRNGWRARPTIIIHWEGIPNSFALHYPFILAFEPNFVEIRNVETGRLVQVIQSHNLRALFAATTATAQQQLPPPPPSVQQQSALLPYNNYSSYSTISSQSQPQSYSNRDSIYGQFGSLQYPLGGGVPQPQQQFVKGQNANRDEIIMVSDDSVVTLNPCAKGFPS